MQAVVALLRNKNCCDMALVVVVGLVHVRPLPRGPLPGAALVELH